MKKIKIKSTIFLFSLLKSKRSKKLVKEIPPFMRELVSELKFIKTCSDNKGKTGNFIESKIPIKRKVSNSNMSKSGSNRRSSNVSANEQRISRNLNIIENMETKIIENSFPTVFNLLKNMET